MKEFSVKTLLICAVLTTLCAVGGGRAETLGNYADNAVYTGGNMMLEPLFLRQEQYDWLNILSPNSIFVVNTTGDMSDQLPGNGLCDDGAGNCSLRGAIQEANAFAGANAIDFNIPGGACPNTISPTTPLPAITEAVTIDGYTQPFSTPNAAATGSNALICIQLDGFSAGSTADGLRISAANTTVRGLAIYRFGDAGIEVTANGSRIEGNFVGVNFSSNAFPNRIGVHVLSSNNVIGGTTLVSRNILSGNTRFGLALTEPAAANTVQNNYVGLGASSTQVANGESGINIFRSAGNTIGGTTANARNIISGNGTLATGGLDGSGINIFGNFLGQAPNNVIRGNYIGTNPDGTAAMANAHCGIFINGAINTTIGGAAPGARNVLSGNTRDGIGMTGTGASNHVIQGNYIGLSANGAADLGNASDGVEIFNVGGNTFGGTAAGEGNVISGNNSNGVLINGADAGGNLFQGNYIGTNAAGTAAIANSNAGLLLLTNNNIVGGTAAGARNYVAGNAVAGIAVILGSGNLIQGNHVGISPSGAAFSNGTGVLIDAANNNTIGGTVTGAGNVISGNSGFGIRIVPFSGPPPTGNQVQGNLIGTNAAGTTAVANNIGVLLQIADGNSVGGTVPEARNIISGNTTSGIDILNCSNNLVQGNYIGTTLDGSTAIANGGNGIHITTSVANAASNNNTIGGTADGAGNLISGNGLSGVRISGNSDNNLLQGNTIGLNIAGNALPNGTSGVVISDSAANGNTVGGSAVNAGNVLSGNSFNGVLITNGASGNNVAGNRIGTNAAGTHARPNTGNGVHIISSSQNVVGGSNAAFRNLISGNLAGGVRISGAGATNNSIQANYIGTNAAGNSYLLNTGGTDFTSNLNYGILIESPANFIGGAAAALRNVISGQFFTLHPGIRITAGGSNTLVQNNYIGTTADGSTVLFNGQGIECLGNNPTIDQNLVSGSRYGIALGSVNGGEITNNIIGLNATQTGFIPNGDALVLSNSSNVRIGENSGNPAPNVIAGNNFTGITINGNGSMGNMIRQNSIYDNGGLGIDLGGDGVTQNDPGDPDLANNFQNYPLLNTVTTTIVGSLNSTPNRSFRIEFYSSTTADPTGYGEGRTFLNAMNVTTDANGNAMFSIANPQPLGSFISATATDLTTSDTSEFAPYKQVLAPTAVRFAGAQARAFDNGVLVEWQTGLETNNLGFNIYRETNGKREPVTKNLVAGSALQTGAQLLSEQNYAWFDAGADERAAYFIEAVDLNGSTQFYGAYPAEKVSGVAPARFNSATLDTLGAASGETVAVSEAFKPARRKTLPPNSPARPASVKIGIKRAGFYRLSAEELFASGLPAGANPENLRLFADGVEQPISVLTGDGFAGIEFYGTGASTAETETRTYYLAASDSAGLRLPKFNETRPASNAGSFESTVERRDRTIYFSGLLNGEAENFFGAVVTNAGANQNLTISGLANTSQTALLEINLQGVTRAAHSVRVELNGALVATVNFDQMEQGSAAVKIPVSQLREGENSVRLVADDAGDVSLVDFVRLTYPRKFVAADNALTFTASGGQETTIRGFSTRNVRVFDVTNANAPFELATKIRREMRANSNAVNPAGEIKLQEKAEETEAPAIDAKSRFAATFAVVGDGTRNLIAVSTAAQPAVIEPNAASNLLDPRNEADLLIITRRDLVDAVEPLAALRRGQGLVVKIVETADIYDEFSDGRKSSKAVKDFLRFAAEKWQRKPQFVLLAGDATYDPKGYVFAETEDVVQTRLVDVENMETASDEWLVDFDDDGAGELAIGRLPARQPDELGAIVQKIIGYERQATLDSMTFVADAPDGFDFAAANQSVRALLPPGVNVTDIQRGRDGSAAKTNLLEAINDGQRIVAYTGHGTSGLWRGNLLTVTDAGALTNGDRLPLFVMMTCLNGFFTNPQNESLSEALLKNPNGGAVAVWASGSTALPDSQTELHREFVRTISNQPNFMLGEAIRLAKHSTGNASVRRAWTLFGDPTMRLYREERQ